MKSFIAKPQEVEHKWYIIDAEGKTLGRLSTEVASILRGKRKPIYTPHVDTGDYVIIINADKVILTALVEAANDATLNLATDNGGAIGITPDATSTTTVAGTAGTKQVETASIVGTVTVDGNMGIDFTAGGLTERALVPGDVLLCVHFVLPS